MDKMLLSIYRKRSVSNSLGYAVLVFLLLVAYEYMFSWSGTNVKIADKKLEVGVDKGQKWPKQPDINVTDNYEAKRREGNNNAHDHILSATTKGQLMLDHIGRSMDVKVEIISNFNDRDSTYSITLINKGTDPIKGHIQDKDENKPWTIYFCFFSTIHSTTEGFLGANKEFKVSRADGRVWQLQPTVNFTTLHKGQKIVLHFEASVSISKYDFYPNWYVSAIGEQPRIIQATQDEDLSFVAPLTAPKQWKRSKQDQFNPFTPKDRFERNAVFKDLAGHQQFILPSPYRISLNNSQEFDFSNPKLWNIVSSEKRLLDNEIQILKSFTGIEYSDGEDDHFIMLEIGKVEVDDLSINRSDEKYKIAMSEASQSIRIVAEKPAGIYYGIRSLMHLIDKNQKVPVTQLLDGPRFPYRGLMLDVSRNFFGKRTIFEMIDSMAVYKLNRLHLHLSDDQGWRLEIPGLPELTEVGGRRSHDLTESETLLPYEGSGPFVNGSGSGHYTVSDFREILQHAKNNHIEVIPEIDMPGHSHAAIRSMKVRHDRLKAKGLLQEAEEYLISDPEDRSEYWAVGDNRETCINPCRESTYTFIEKVIKEVYKIYESILPLKVIHIGCDEIPWGAYTESPICTKFRKRQPEFNKTIDLKFYFKRRVSAIFANKNIKLQMWEDGVFHSDSGKLVDLSGISFTDLISNSWQNRWDRGEGRRAYLLANQGAKVVLGHATHLYLDHPQEPDPEERGLYWATRYIDSIRIFKYMPESVYDNMDFGINGEALTKEQICKNVNDACLPLTKPENIIGMEGALWTEVVRTQEQMFSQLFPRIIALAERAWHKADWEGEVNYTIRERKINEAWEKFANTLGYRELERMESPAYIRGRPFMAAQKYYLPPPGLKNIGTEIHVNTYFPGTMVQYYDIEAKSWTDIPGHVHPYKGVKLKFRTRGGGKGHVTSRSVIFGNG